MKQTENNLFKKVKYPLTKKNKKLSKYKLTTLW